MSKQYILLDWDGNLVKTLDVWLGACREALLKRDIDLPDAEIVQSFGKLESSFTRWGVTDLEQSMEDLDAAAKRLLPGVNLYPDALAVLSELESRGKKMALITTSSRHLADDALKEHDMTHYFDVIIGGDEVTYRKPHAEPLQKAMRQMGAKPGQSIMIGDTVNDIGAAHNAGVDSVLFYPPEHETFYDFEELQASKPTHIVKDFRKILEIV